jgi:8-oxo-dGTP pyrophosphatase MutT (NUDIX family)
MLHLIPAPLHRAGLRLAHAVRRRWWRLARVRLNGCRVLAFDPEGRILLIRHSYGSGNWMLPGGGIGRGEAPLAAGLRELVEETGCRLDNARVLAVVEEPLHGTVNRVHVITGTASGTPQGDGREVIELAFFDPAALPANLSPALAGRMAEWLSAARAEPY